MKSDPRAIEVRRFIVKCVLFVAILVTTHALLTGVVLPLVAPWKVDAYRRVEAGGIIFFGDSSNRSCGENDIDRRPIHEILGSELGGRPVTPIARGAYHMRVFAAVSRQIAKSSTRPKFAIITVNLRTFSETWYSRPAYSFHDIIRRLEVAQFTYDALYKPLGVFKALPQADDTEHQETLVYDGDKLLGTVSELQEVARKAWMKQSTPEIRRKLMAYLYLYPLGDEHPLIVSLRSAVASLKEGGVMPIVYVTPIDHETGTAWYGPTFRPRVAENVAFIAHARDAAAVETVDMSFDLPASRFTYDRNPNEHVDQTGRMHIARRLAEAIRACEGAPPTDPLAISR